MTTPLSRRAAVLATLVACLATTAASCGHKATVSPTVTTPPVATTQATTPPPATTPPAPTTAPASTTPPASADLSGTWDGTWGNTVPDHSTGSFTIKWTQHGSTLAGTISISGTPCLNGGAITGTINGGTISFGAVHGSVTVHYTGTVSGTKMSGTYDTDCGHAHGKWSATHM